MIVYAYPLQMLCLLFSFDRINLWCKVGSACTRWAQLYTFNKVIRGAQKMRPHVNYFAGYYIFSYAAIGLCFR